MRLLLFFLFHFSFLLASAQQYGGRRPIDIRLILTPPYSTYLPDYVSPSNNTFSLQVRNTDNTALNYNLFFKLSIWRNQNELVIQSNPNWISQPTTLQPGMNFIYGSDLAQYFEPQNLEFLGTVSRDYYNQYKAVPEGWYKICVSGWDYTVRDQQVANESCQSYYLAKSGPPMLNMPYNTEQILSNAGQNILFMWTPQNLSNPNSANNTSYVLDLWEIPKIGMNREPEFIANTLKPYFSTTLNNQYNYTYTAGDAILKDGYTYAWRVTAKDNNGIEYFQNGGKSNVWSFSFTDISEHPNARIIPNVKISGLSAEPDFYDAVIKWQKHPIYTHYKVYYTPANNNGEKKVYEEITPTDTLYVDRLSTKSQWEYWVRGITADSLEGPEGEHQLFTTKDYSKAFGCDVPPPRPKRPKGFKEELKNVPREAPLQAREEILLDFGVLRIDKVESQGNHKFKGEGKRSNPFGPRGYMKVIFREVSVNQYGQMIEGEIVYVSDLDGKMDEFQQNVNAIVAVNSVNNVDNQRNENQQKYADQNFAEDMPVFNDIEKVDVTENADGSRTVSVTTKGNATPQSISVPAGKALLIEDSKPADSATGAKHQYVVKQDATSGKGEKAEFGGLTTTYNKVALSDEYKNYIIRALKELDSIEYAISKKAEWEKDLIKEKDNSDIERVLSVDNAVETQGAGEDINISFTEENTSTLREIQKKLYLQNIIRNFITSTNGNTRIDWISQIGNSFKVGDKFFVDYIKSAKENNKTDTEIITLLKQNIEIIIGQTYADKL